MNSHPRLARAATLFVVFLLFAPSGFAQRERVVPPGLESTVKQFFRDKAKQARALAEKESREQAPVMWDFFEAGENGDWATVAELYRTMRRGAYQYENTRPDKRLETMAWQPVNEAYGAFAETADGAEEYVSTFGREILDSMPRGSVYFGGTDPGRWLVTLFSKSHERADPCFVLTQNALADSLYLKYVRTMYGDRMTTPTEEDSKDAFAAYMKDAEQRLDENALKPGENVTRVDGKVQVSGQVAVMAINALLAKRIFDANPKREFFVEESFPLDWMYPHLAPHGMILKLNREPLKEMPAGVLREDREFWTGLANRALGPWLKPETSVDEVCAFAAKIFDAGEMEEFKGDTKFVENKSSCRTYSKLRSAIGGVYAWRAKNSPSPEEKDRMVKEADFAFRQAFALCPYSPEAVVRYCNLLMDQGRKNDALRVAQTAEQVDPRSRTIGNLVGELEAQQ